VTLARLTRCTTARMSILAQCSRFDRSDGQPLGFESAIPS
jgi:hypothetical protein